MTGQESNPALLFRIYVDYGRYTEATNLLLEYIESFASMVNFLFPDKQKTLLRGNQSIIDRIIIILCRVNYINVLFILYPC